MASVLVRAGSLYVTMATMILLSASCTKPNPAFQRGPLLPDECRAGEEVMETFVDFEKPEMVDLLFVVQAAGEIGDYQRALADALPSFLDGLAQEGFNVRMAVTTADDTAGGELAPLVNDIEGCEQNVRQVARGENDDWLMSAMCNVQQGSDGARRQKPLGVLRQALVDDPSSLESFRRERGRLVVVVLANEDDCTGDQWQDDGQNSVRDLCAWQAGDLISVSSWVEDLRATASVPEGLSLAVISGPPAAVDYEAGESVRAVCRSTLGSSYPSQRLFEGVRRFGDQGLFLSACVLDFYDHLDEISRRLIRRDNATLCMAEPMAHEPLEVWGISADEGDGDVDFGDGFVFLGPTVECANGAIQLRREGTRGLDQVEIRYCALP